MRAARSSFACLALLSCFLADTIVLRDGRRIQGKIVSQNRKVVVVESGVGRLEIARSDIVEILEERTPREEFEVRAESAESADEWYELGLWAREKRLRKEAQRAFESAVKVDARHAGAHEELGHVLDEGEWVTPEERDVRVAARMRAEGLVSYEGRWVTPEEREKLEAGYVLVDGTWLSADQARREQGLELFEGLWMPRPRALALASAAAVDALLGRELTQVQGDQVLVAGEFEAPYLEEIAEGLGRARLWFDGVQGVESGLGLLGERLAEFYVFGREPAGYLATVPSFVALTPSLGESAVGAIQSADGFYWWTPWVFSSARLSERMPVHLRGHCLHHWGHLLLNRLGSDLPDGSGRLLPPWYDEGFAALTEYRTFGRNFVFCQAHEVPSAGSGGTSARGGTTREFNTQSFREGAWREALRDALEAGDVRPFDRLAGLELHELELLDIAASVAILSWIEDQGAAESPPDPAPPLRRFHELVRAGQPDAPPRVEPDVRRRLETYDAAFRAAVGLDRSAADAAWRAWFLSR